MKNKHIESIKRKVASPVQKIPKVDCVAIGEDPADVIQYLLEFIEGLGYNVYSEEISDMTETYGAIISKKALTQKQIDAIIYDDLGLSPDEDDEDDEDGNGEGKGDRMWGGNDEFMGRWNEHDED